MVPKDCDVGVCAHELGHLVFQWQDFYDPNYAKDGDYWDGAGQWDLMAGGSYNRDGSRPAHPAALHKTQHGWLAVDEVAQSQSLELLPIGSSDGRAVRLRSPRLKNHQYLLLEHRMREGFDADLPGEGLLVWQVDEIKEMTGAADPGMYLIQADGRKDLNNANDFNKGDAGDPFPGAVGVEELKEIRLPNGQDAGIRLKRIRREGLKICLDAEIETPTHARAEEMLRPVPLTAAPVTGSDQATHEVTIRAQVDGLLETALVWIEGHDLGMFERPAPGERRGDGNGTVHLRSGLYTLALEARGRPGTRWTVRLGGASSAELTLTVSSVGSGFASALVSVSA
jgi:hypothetical protein